MKNQTYNNELRQLTDALLRVQTNIGSVIMNADNPYFNSRFANLDACWEYVRPFFNKEGILIQQIVHETDNGVSIETLFIGYGTDLSGGKLPVPAQKQLDPQAYGSAVSYAKRYSLMQACGLATTKEDDDGEKARQSAEKQEAKKQSSPAPDLKESLVLKNAKGHPYATFPDTHAFIGGLRKVLANPEDQECIDVFKANSSEIERIYNDLPENDRDLQAFEKLIDIYSKKVV